MSLLKRIIEQKKEKKKLQEIIEKVTPSDERLISLIEPLIPEPIPGEKGDVGDTPTTEQILELVRPLIPPAIPGEPGHTPTDEELVALIKPLIPEPIKGDAGHTPTITELKDIIKPLIPKPIKGDKGDKPDHKWEDTKLMFEKPDGEWGQAVDLKGPVGETVKQEITRLGGSVSGGKTTIKEDGTTITTAASFLNFGTGITAVANGSGVDVTMDAETQDLQAVTDIRSTTTNPITVGGITLPYRVVTANYTLTSTDYTVNCNGSFTVTLPTAVGISGIVYVVKNSGTGAITVATTSSQTIDGQLTQTLTQYDALTVVSSGSVWIII
jgi:hypothetical protein